LKKIFDPFRIDYIIREQYPSRRQKRILTPVKMLLGKKNYHSEKKNDLSEKRYLQVAGKVV